MKGYKAFNKDLTCRGFQYEIGKTYKIEGKPIVCRRGFHFCQSIADVYAFYDASDNTRICEVEAIGEIDTNDHIKFCTNKIKIVKEITDSYLKKANTGAGNYGYCNSGQLNHGNFNCGDCNFGNRNSGNFNSGNYNSGDYNSGIHNSGRYNSGSFNSGNNNSGDVNSGSCNYGNYNSGRCNFGIRNSGDFNSENYNSGNFNSGDHNSGNFNSGDHNSGNWNSGSYNSGDWNSGACNSGDWNYSDRNSGCFCTKEDSNIKMFDENSNWTYNDWFLSDAYAILSRCPHTEIIVEWIDESDMNEEEKKNNPSYKTTGGYLKVTKENGNRQEWWDDLSEEEKNEVMSLPNFDADKFYMCTGIKVRNEVEDCDSKRVN